MLVELARSRLAVGKTPVWKRGFVSSTRVSTDCGVVGMHLLFAFRFLQRLVFKISGINTPKCSPAQAWMYLRSDILCCMFVNVLRLPGLLEVEELRLEKLNFFHWSWRCLVHHLKGCSERPLSCFPKHWAVHYFPTLVTGSLSHWATELTTVQWTGH